MSKLSNLEPKRVFGFFEDLSNIPCGEGDLESIRSYIEEYAKSHSFNYEKDDNGNIIIFVPATLGYEKAEPIILQGHIGTAGMVISHGMDFTKNHPVEMSVIDDYIFARGTALSTDDRAAIALCLAAADDGFVAHPEMELVFTCGSNSYSDGASSLDISKIKGRRMINLNSQEEGVILTSSAGGLVGKMNVPVKYHRKKGNSYKIVVSGFVGGHSGRDIGKYRGNANIIMGRLLHFLGTRVDFDIISLSGGLMHNSIPRDADCSVLVEEKDITSFENLIIEFEETIKNEYKANENNISIYSNYMGETEEDVLVRKTQERVIFLLNTVPDGAQKMSQEVKTKGLVETSLNIGIMRMDEKKFYLEGTIRSMISSAKYALSDKLRYLTETIGGIYTETGDYPAWEYNENSELASLCSNVYRNLFGQNVRISGVHAGLECGTFFSRIKGIDIVSMGPEIVDAHTQSEKLSISSTVRTWNFLISILRTMNI
ncbi:MAG: beta-Ala-His dipeptidase [Lachnospiraceae bacterium]|nr:beta-Ala-His dipeptidase [Lachnospiraceae bacterium]